MINNRSNGKRRSSRDFFALVQMDDSYFLSSDSILASASAEVMLYNDAVKQWEPPKGNDGVFIVQIVKNLTTNTFRIIAFSSMNKSIVLNCNIHHKLKYHTATPTFHQWRDEQRQVYGLNFPSPEEARQFCCTMSESINFLGNAHLNGHSHNEYQQIHHDNVYQDPHQHIPHNQSAPTFRDHEEQNGLHPNFRKSSHSVQSSQQLTQQQRRSSQSSSSSSNAGLSGMMAQISMAPKPSNIPPAPAPPSINGAPPAPPPPPSGGIAPQGKAPPAPPPPPPNLAVACKGSSFADELKNKAGKLNKTAGPATTVVEGSTLVTPAASAPPPPAPKGDFLQELTQSFKNRKANQAKADAVDNKSNTSNGSSDSGVFPPATKPKVNGNGTVGSPKTHRKAPSASSISSQEESIVKGVNEKLNGLGSIPVTTETLERFRAELMAEVRLEINKAKQDIIEALRAELRR